LVVFGDRSASVGADVEVLISLQDEWNGTFHPQACNLLAVDFQHADAAASDTADVVKGECSEPQAVILEVELQRVLAGRKRICTFPADAFQVDQVPQKDRFVLQHIEPIAAKSAALGHDHSFRPAFRDIYI